MTLTRAHFTDWHKSSHSDDGQSGGCVGVGHAPGLRGIEDTKLGKHSPIITIGEPAFQALLDAAKGDRLA
jgi:hypothetical protein